jgi:hypothetical protein
LLQFLALWNATVFWLINHNINITHISDIVNYHQGNKASSAEAAAVTTAFDILFTDVYHQVLFLHGIYLSLLVRCVDADVGCCFPVVGLIGVLSNSEIIELLNSVVESSSNVSVEVDIGDVVSTY